MLQIFTFTLEGWCKLVHHGVRSQCAREKAKHLQHHNFPRDMPGRLAHHRLEHTSQMSTCQGRGVAEASCYQGMLQKLICKLSSCKGGLLRVTRHGFFHCQTEMQNTNLMSASEQSRAECRRIRDVTRNQMLLAPPLHLSLFLVSYVLLTPVTRWTRPHPPTRVSCGRTSAWKDGEGLSTLTALSGTKYVPL